MTYIVQFLLIFIIWQAGEFLTQIFSLIIPGPIMGMIILLVLLQTKILKEKYIKKAGDLFLKYLPFFFIPSGVAILGYQHLIKDYWISLVLILFVSVTITMLVAGKVTQFFLDRQRGKYD